MTTETLILSINYDFSGKAVTKDELAITRNGNTIKPFQIDGNEVSYYIIHDMFADVIVAREPINNPDRQWSYVPQDEFSDVVEEVAWKTGYPGKLASLSFAKPSLN